MRDLELKTNFYKGINTVSIDGNAIAHFSALNNYTDTSFLDWAHEFFATVEDELNDEFTITVSGEELEIRMLRLLANNCDDCHGIEIKEYPLNMRTDERYKILSNIAKKYNVSVEVCKVFVKVFSFDENILGFDFLENVKLEEAQVCILENEDVLSNVISNASRAQFILVLGEEEHLEWSGDKYIWHLPIENKLKELNRLVTYLGVLPTIKNIRMKIDKVIPDMKTEEIKAVNMALAIDSIVDVDLPDVMNLKMGTRCTPQYSVTPDNGVKPSIHITSSNIEVVDIREGSLITGRRGTATVSFYQGADKIPFAKKNIRVYRDDSVREIHLKIRDMVMHIDQTQEIKLMTVPSDADNRDSVQLEVSDDSVLHLDSDGKIMAVGAGECTITARVDQISTSAVIHVLPQASEIVIIPSEIDCYVNESVDVTVRVLPENCSNKTYEWDSSDESVAVVIYDHGLEKIHAKRVNENGCVLTCRTVEGECSATCTVKVKSTLDRETHAWLSIAAISFVFTFIAGIFNLGPICSLLAVAGALIGGAIAIFKNRNDISWAILLMAASVVLTWLLW
ncbi:Bacterial Ig-like domain (group 2) [uncultured Eubacterium sp.]|uniref:Ig-like domain-containing protein n=1 Tax=Brotomerdimonas butyrica TaxID=2981721 RepID=UPI000820461B|nr:hypothetical protein [Brotomerdimonas butyrica]MCU6756211.1 hypothetical protein [Brotomerdimonas butyrica]SCH72491.1 Bacterial Ig-like domain (group 2) [uncultured Eubacterium sp.]